ncbi:hypothetical protein R3I93_021491 [Phoxinus phoxinus]|uniref:Uncharacterized protein n=1 Tax=Phoxinus phoxinus TaxID=58324 RepID=A0AAN9GT04_9TELE
MREFFKCLQVTFAYALAENTDLAQNPPVSNEGSSSHEIATETKQQKLRRKQQNSEDESRIKTSAKFLERLLPRPSRT